MSGAEEGDRDVDVWLIEERSQRISEEAVDIARLMDERLRRDMEKPGALRDVMYEER